MLAYKFLLFNCQVCQIIQCRHTIITPTALRYLTKRKKQIKLLPEPAKGMGEGEVTIQSAALVEIENLSGIFEAIDNFPIWRT